MSKARGKFEIKIIILPIESRVNCEGIYSHENIGQASDMILDIIL